MKGRLRLCRDLLAVCQTPAPADSLNPADTNVPDRSSWVAVEAVDFRKGIDSLAELCRAKLNADPFSGSVFVFRSRRATSIKILVYDGQGFWLATKRLSKGRFRWWPQSNEASKQLRVHQAQVLLAAGNPEIDAAPVWRSV